LSLVIFWLCASQIAINHCLNFMKLTLVFSNLPITPSVDIDNEHDPALYMNRRSSSGVLLSPEVEISNTAARSGMSSAEAQESDGFYLLKKDSQRRATLSKVLSQDEATICKVWMEKIKSDRKEEVALSLTHLELLIRVLRAYIMEPKRDIMETGIGELKQSLNFDTTAVDHLHLALYSFQVRASLMLVFFN
jgi:mitogen-activated protein kinase kinase kinase 5